MLVRLSPAAVLLTASLLQAQQAPSPSQVPGYSPQAAARERAVEAAAVRATSPERSMAHSRALSVETHVAGTPAQARTRDYVIAQMRQMGMETEVRTYRVYMPHAQRVTLARVSPDPMELRPEETAVSQDPSSSTAQYPQVNGYSASGDVTGEVVYVNYGLIEDYAKLDSIGVSVRGKIVMARYGRSFRGIKAREAEKHGAAALIIYSDPRDDGYAVGDVYPEGPMRPSQAVQRGSVLNSNGDPSTPGRPSTANAARLSVEEMVVPRIPVVPMSYGNAGELLRYVRGKEIPPAWQGGLPFRYHLGPGPVVARVSVVTDAGPGVFKEIHNTFGVIRGSERPDEIVMIGAHRDAWGPGAADNVSGTVSVLEAARAVMEQVRAGNRPSRTMVFATWDAEEWGLIGSTEYVEDDSLRLMKGGVAYLNQDVAANGPDFGGGGSPSLRALLRDVARAVPHPSGEGSVYQVWRKKSGVAADSLEPAMGDPGGGSDFAGFYNHLGIPHTDWGFGGAYGVYHSQYDSYAWMDRFGDPGFKFHAAAASVGAAMMLRLANAEVLPYDYAEFARTMRGYVPGIQSAMRGKGWDTTTVEPLGRAIDGMRQAATEFAAARDRALAAGSLPRAQADRVNAALLRVERALTRPEGLRTRPWFRNLIYAADEDNGYANIVFPSVNEAARGGGRELTERELADLATRFTAATAALTDATRALAR